MVQSVHFSIVRVEPRFRVLLFSEISEITTFPAPVTVNYMNNNLDSTKPRQTEHMLLVRLSTVSRSRKNMISTVVYLCHSSSSNQVGWWMSNSISFVVSVRTHVLASVARICRHAAWTIGVRFCAVFCSHSQWARFGNFKTHSIIVLETSFGKIIQRLLIGGLLLSLNTPFQSRYDYAEAPTGWRKWRGCVTDLSRISAVTESRGLRKHP